MTTSWHTAKAVGGNRLPDEWITVDLQSELPIGEIVLEWNGYYAIDYLILVSTDNINWITVFNTTSGDGGTDNIFIPVGTAAQYVRLETYSWNNSTWRNWLNEFEIYGNASPTPIPTQSPTPSPIPVNSPTPGPSPTPTQTSTPEPSPTATTTPPNSIHTGDLDSLSASFGNTWTAMVMIVVHNSNHVPVSDAIVTGTWSGGYSGSSICTTNASGECEVTSGAIRKNVSSAIFSVGVISHTELTYLASDSHDPDGDSNGTTITALKP